MSLFLGGKGALPRIEKLSQRRTHLFSILDVGSSKAVSYTHLTLPTILLV